MTDRTNCKFILDGLHPLLRDGVYFDGVAEDSVDGEVGESVGVQHKALL